MKADAMSIYFFDFADDGALATGDMGLDYATRDAARSDAVSALQSIVRDLVLDRHSRREVSIKIRDEDGPFFEAKIVFTAELLNRHYR